MANLTSENAMSVSIFRGKSEIGTGELLPNGANMALCPQDKDLQLLDFEADTEKVEAVIPMEFFLNDKLVSKGELYNSGEYYCLCPVDQDLDLIKKDSQAKLSIESEGKKARLDICSTGKKGS